jgi:hypothetical protein
MSQQAASAGQVQNPVNHLDLVEWPSKFNFLKGRAEPASVRPLVRRMAG